MVERGERRTGGRRRGGVRESGLGSLASWCSAQLLKVLIRPAFSRYGSSHRLPLTSGSNMAEKMGKKVKNGPT